MNDKAANRIALISWAAAIILIAVGQLWKASEVETTLGIIFLVAGTFLSAAVFYRKTVMALVGYVLTAVACLTRVVLGQFIPHIVNASRLILTATWLLLAFCAAAQAFQAHAKLERGEIHYF